jgi:hypothetical protein
MPFIQTMKSHGSVDREMRRLIVWVAAIVSQAKVDIRFWQQLSCRKGKLSRRRETIQINLRKPSDFRLSKIWPASPADGRGKPAAKAGATPG